MDLFPAIEPYDSGFLPVADGNSVYWESVGSPAGLPIVYLHGGPGAGCTVGMRRYFDPSLFRAVLFDQRGCGRSRPRVDDPAIDLSTNTTGNLIADIESLRDHLGIDRWVVAGVSWDVSLGLAYAQTHPERVIGMALGAITSGSRREVEWITRDMRRIFPREWERFVEPVPEGERDGNLAAAYARLLAHPDAAVRENAALRWCEWEDTHISLAPGWTPSRRYQDPVFRMVFARLVTHYWGNDCFLAENQLFDGMHRLAGIPAILVHGRYDVSGPLDTAWEISTSSRNGNQYRLGIKMFELGNHFVHSRPTGLKEVAAPLLGDLFLHVGATVGLSVLESWDVILIDQITSSRSRIVTPVVGGRAPALSTASGKALVAFLDTENRERAVAHHVRQEPSSSRTVRHAGRLRSQLAEVRENGHSWACDEFSMGMSAVASPVLVNGRPIAAVSVSAATGRFDRAKAAAAVLRTSRLIATQFIRARELAQDYSTSELQWDIEDEFDRVS